MSMKDESGPRPTNPGDARRRRSNASFVESSDGVREDASLHDQILAAGTPDLEATGQFSREIGYCEDRIKRLFGED